MKNPDANAVLFAIETLAHCPPELSDDELKILIRQAQTYIEACGPLWKAWEAMMEQGASGGSNRDAE